MRFMNSGVNFRRAASTPLLAIFLFIVSSILGCSLDLHAAQESELRIDERAHFRRTQIAGHENHGAREINLAVVAQCQGGFIQNAKSKFQRASLAFSISSNRMKLSLTVSVWCWLITSWLSSG